MSEEPLKLKAGYVGRTKGSMPVRGVKKAKTGKNKNQGNRQSGDRDIDREGEYVKVGFLGWSRDFKNRISDFNDVCKELYKLYGEEEGKLALIAKHLRKFNRAETNNPKHMSYAQLEGVFWSYAILKKIPPRFVLKNYGFDEQYFKEWVCVRFVNIIDNDHKPSKEDEL